MTTGVEDGAGPVGQGWDVEYSISNDETFQITPMTLDQVHDMYKRNLVVRQQLEGGKFGFLRAFARSNPRSGFSTSAGLRSGERDGGMCTRWCYV